ncbi:unnamed protein product [Prorocentrum cordatum]|uniref:SAM-dependent MTase RsmB/NOP-type domain-containing protein n=1 Tax=Prorocentrum cordatum TaxID=2364126 RepID=A0ABN9X6V0_9DINO|nr:unnamed protein product [Polarella glacialis]
MSAGFVPAMALPSMNGVRVSHGSLAPAKSVLPEWLVPQSASSAATVHILAPEPGERVLDLCAAPGGKTRLAAELMHNRGEIVAVESSEPRLARLRQLLAHAGASIVECVLADGAKWRSGSPRRPFDRALVDAPCSASGLWPRLDWKRVTPDGVAALAAQQFSLLAAAAREVRPGGVVVYSVCSYLPQETLAVALRALAELPLELDGEIGRGGTSGAGLHGGWGDDCDMMGFFSRSRKTSGFVAPWMFQSGKGRPARPPRAAAMSKRSAEDSAGGAAPAAGRPVQQLGSGAGAKATALHGSWKSAKGTCVIGKDPVTARLSYMEPLEEGQRLHGWLDAVAGEESLWQGSLALLEAGKGPWYGPSFGPAPEVVGDIRVRLKGGDPKPAMETQIRVADEEGADWEDRPTAFELDRAGVDAAQMAKPNLERILPMTQADGLEEDKEQGDQKRSKT